MSSPLGQAEPPAATGPVLMAAADAAEAVTQVLSGKLNKREELDFSPNIFILV